MKLRRGDRSPFITKAVIRPLVERGYLTWRDAGWTGDPYEGGKEWYGNGIAGRTERRGSTINRRVEAAVKRFQEDSGIFHREGGASRGVDTLHPGRSTEGQGRPVSSGVVGRRTLAALGVSTTSPDTQRLIAKNMRRQAAEAEIQNPEQGEAVAKRIAEIRGSYPTLDARVTAALALGGHGLEDPVTKTMLAMSMKRSARPSFDRDPWEEIPHRRGERVPLVDELGNQLVDPTGKLTPYTDEAKPKDDGYLGGAGGIFAAVPAFGLDRLGEMVGLENAGDAIRTPVSWTQEQVVKPAARGLFTALETPYQAMQGEFRNQFAAKPIWETGDLAESYGSYAGRAATNPALSQTSGVIAAEQALAGETPDLGTGYFPGGQVEQEQARRARAAFSIDGHAATPGRYFASLVVEPGTKPYNMVSGITDALAITVADPTNYLVGGSSIARATGRTLQVTKAGDVVVPGRLIGLVPGVRRSVNPQTLDEALTTGVLRPFVEKAAKLPEDGGYTYNELRRILAGDSESAALIARAENADEVRTILDPRLGIGDDMATLGKGLGTTVRNVPKAPYQWTRRLRGREQKMRAFGMQPGHALDLGDMDDAAENFDRLLRSGKLTAEQRNEFGSALVLAEGPEERFSVIMGASNALAQRAIDDGIDPQLAREVSRFWKNWDEERHWMVDLMSGDDTNWFVDIDDARYNLPHPALDIDFMRNYVPLPDVRELRRITSRLSRFSRLDKEHLEHPGTITKALDAGMRYWRGAVLARPAIMLRVGGDEQLRMAATGEWSHPWQMLQSIISGPKGQVDSLGKNLWDEAERAALTGDWTAYARARSRGWAEWAVSPDDRLVKQKDWKVWDRRQAPREFVSAWQEQFERLRASEVMTHLAQHGPDATKAWLAEGGDGNKLWQMMTNAAADRVEGVAAAPDIGTYVDNAYAHLVDMTQHDGALIDVVATGRYEGEHIAKIGKSGLLEHNKDFRRELTRRAEEDLAPTHMPGRRYERVSPDQIKTWDRVMTVAFDWFMTRPTNRFARSPMFINTYWSRTDELLPFLDQAALRETAKSARQMGRADVAEKATAMAETANSRRTVLTHVESDQIAKAYALDEVRNLLYDVGERTTVFDTMRNLIPFGEAWKEVLTRWARIMSQRPQNLRRLQVGIEGARGADLDGDGRGFFYTDPTTKQEMFVWPGSEWVTKQALGVPIPIGGSVTGLNMVAQGLPGVGPAVQVPAGWILPNDPDWDWLREVFDPYGAQENDPGQSKLEAALGGLQPPWFKRLTQVGVPFLKGTEVGPEQERARATMAMASYLATRHPAWSRSKVLEEARDKSQTFWLIRMLGSGILPTAPIPQFQIVDKRGRKHSLMQLKTEYFEGVEKARGAGEDVEFDQSFIAKYGLDAYGELAPITETTGVPLPRTKKQVAWARENRELAKDFPYVYGFFVPDDPDGSYDERASTRQLHDHERFTLSPEEQRRVVDDRKGWAIYREYTEGLGTEEEDYAERREIAAEIKKVYPGWQDRTGLPESVNRDDQLAQLRKAVRDKRLRGTDFAAGIRVYLEERDAIAAKAREAGYAPARLEPQPTGWIRTTRFADDREWLREVAAEIRAEFPSTGVAFDSLFRAELEED